MTEFQRILFPVDFSPICIASIPAVKDMVQHYKARLALLHVVEIPLSWYGSMNSALPEDWNILEQAFQAGEKRLTDFAAEQFSDLSEQGRLETFCDKGDPANAIISLAEESKPDLIMMPTHGYGPFRSFLLGGTTTRVLHRAPCPLWTSAHSEAAAKHPGIRKVICAVNLKTQRIDLIQSTVAIAQKFSAEAALVSCVTPQALGPSAMVGADFDRYITETSKSEMAELQQQAGANLKAYVETGDITDVVQAAAQDFGADLIVIGRGSAQKPLGRLTSHAYGIIRNASCPVLSL